MMLWMSMEVVVFPSVPVTPIIVRRREGKPARAAASTASASAASSTCTYGTGALISAGGRSPTTAATPRATASGMKRWPSAEPPTRATKMPPGSTARESSTIGAMMSGSASGRARIPGTCLSRSESFIVLGASVMGKRFQGSYYQGIDYSKSNTKPRRPTSAKPPEAGGRNAQTAKPSAGWPCARIQVVDRQALDKLLAHVGKLRAVARVDLLALTANNHAAQDRRIGDKRHILGAERLPDTGLLRVVERNSGHDLQRRSQPLRLRRQRSEELIHHLLLPVLACHLANQMAGSSDAQRDDLAAHVGESQLLLGLGLAAGLLDDAAGLSASLLLDLAGS